MNALEQLAAILGAPHLARDIEAAVEAACDASPDRRLSFPEIKAAVEKVANR